MSACEAGSAPAATTAEEARVRVGTALAVLELAGQLLEVLPPPEAALALGDRALYRYLQAAETARGWLVGHEAGDSLDRPGPSSALGDGQRIYEWTEKETERHFLSALQDWSETT
ncbi:MAG TPA: hypothetical protein VM599_10660 [Thermoanaerobaculia bacterium]|nr:hypothetical protein [Thermoanaerobaculia bacterium]